MDGGPPSWDNPATLVTLDAKRRLGRGEDWLTVVEQCPVPIDDLPRRRRQYFRPRR
jgi:hypothetical protein